MTNLHKTGAVLACSEGVYNGFAPDVKAINTVGCGDSMIGALAVSIVRRYSAEDALKLSLEVSAANAMCKQTGSFYAKDLESLYGMGIVRKVK